MSYSHSRTWKSPNVLIRERRARIMNARKHICPGSPFFDNTFDEEIHNMAMQLAKVSYDAIKAQNLTKEKAFEKKYEAETGRKLTFNAFGGRKFDDGRGTILAMPTIWCPAWQIAKEHIAPWPTLLEMKYEGDDRVATALEHGRFPPVPRYPANETVTWSQVHFLPQHQFDVIHRCFREEDRLFYTLETHEDEISDKVGRQLIDSSLMAMLNLDED